MSQNHFTLSFLLKPSVDAEVVAELLPPLMPALFRANDTIGTVHYSRFTVLSEKTLLLLGDFDGEFDHLMADLAKLAGPVFDAILRHVVDPPPTPVAANGGAELHPFLVILPIKSYLHFVTVQLILRARGRGTTKDLDSVGTPHFAQFVPLEDNQIGFFTVYDGSFDKYIADFTKNIGPVFDLIFKFTKDAPPSPCRKHLQEFIDFAAGANRTPIGFYQAYPGLTVQDIHALIADSKSPSAAAG